MRAWTRTKSRVAIVGVGALSVVGVMAVAGSGAAPGVVGARSLGHSATHAGVAKIAIRPMLISRRASVGQPPTSADCVAAFTVPCYDAAQIQTAYDERPLFRMGSTAAARPS